MKPLRIWSCAFLNLSAAVCLALNINQCMWPNYVVLMLKVEQFRKYRENLRTNGKKMGNFINQSELELECVLNYSMPMVLCFYSAIQLLLF